MKSEDLQIPRQSATLRLQVEERIRAAIASGMFAPGQRLVERELCEQIGVGRTSVREALRQLEAEGLVTVYPHRGPVVTTLSAADAQQLYSVRGLLEGFAGKLFAQLRTPEELDRLNAAYATLEDAVKAGLHDTKTLVEIKNLFYGVLLDGSGNPYLKQMLTIIHNRVNLLRATSLAQPGRPEKSLAELRLICEAVRDGDGEAAQRACIAHVEAAARLVGRIFEEGSEAQDDFARGARRERRRLADPMPT
jgi:DNA-binding GntR family transcriptional regulator